MEGPVTWSCVLLWLLGGLATFAAVSIGVISLYLTYIYRKYAHIPSPPRESFFLGHGANVKRKFREGNFFAETLLQYVHEVGHTFVLIVMGKPLVFTVDQDAVKEVLVTGNFPKAQEGYKGLQFLYGERFLGKGLVTETDTEVWAKTRASVNPAFHRQLLRNLMTEFNQTGDDLMSLLAENADGKTVITMIDFLNKATLDVIGKVAFSMDIESMKDASSPFPAAIFKVLHGFSESTRHFISNKIPAINAKFKNEVIDAIRLLRETGQKMLEKREEELKKDMAVPTDVISFVIDARKSDPTMTVEKILDNFVTFFIAGQETTANALGFIIRELGRHPEVLQRLREEVDEVIGENHDVLYDDLGKLEYCSMIIKETLRLYPPAPITFRELDRNHQVGGFMVPKGATIAISPYVSHRMEEFIPDVMTFDPDRFRPDSPKKPPTYAYFPFSLGPRNCIGMTFAQMESKVILVKFVQRFNFKLDPKQSFGIQETATLRPKDGTRLTLTERDL